MASLPPVAPNLTPPPVPASSRASAAMPSRPLLAPTVTPFLAPASEPALGSRASLYVGDLDRGVAEGQLFMIFSQVAPVASLRVCRDIAGRSLGHGYVNFHSREDANRALEYLNFTPINGKPIRVMFSNRDPTLRRNGLANVFIKNLEVNIDSKGLSNMFSGFGTILSCKVATDLNGQSKGYGFVQFTNEKSAMDAINSLNGMLANGKQLFVSLFIRRQERQHITVSTFTNVYIKNFPREFTDDDLRQEFAPFGEITSAIVMRDANGSSRCFGFVNFKRSECAIEAIKTLNGKTVNDLIMYVGRAQKKKERQDELKAKFESERNEKFKQFQALNLYVKNLDDGISDAHLRNLFENFGELGSCKVMVDTQGRSKGFGFVSFKTIEDVHKAINEMNGKMIGRKPLYVCVAQRKEERRAILVAHFARAQNIGVVVPRVQQNIVAHQLYSSPGAHGMLSPQLQGFGYQQYPRQNFFLGMAPNFMMPQNIPRPMHHGEMMGPWHGVDREMHQQQQMFNPIVNQDITYMNETTTAAMVPPCFSTSTVAQRFTQTDITFTFGAPYIPNNKNNKITPTLASTDLDKQHVILGEKLYPLVEQLEPEFATKVTRMLLELENTEILHLIESDSDLRNKVFQAMEALRQSKPEEIGDASDLASTLSSSTPSHDAINLNCAPPYSSVSNAADHLASTPNVES
uniref:Uncharacterized protein n=1 Tax=Avena sativa TaxID=4498 RepID=A0ACD6AED8_AVESA